MENRYEEGESIFLRFNRTRTAFHNIIFHSMRTNSFLHQAMGKIPGADKDRLHHHHSWPFMAHSGIFWQTIVAEIRTIYFRIWRHLPSSYHIEKNPINSIVEWVILLLIQYLSSYLLALRCDPSRTTTQSPTVLTTCTKSTGNRMPKERAQLSLNVV